jgi:hypothetical protein
LEKRKEKENPGTCFQVSINSNHHDCFLGVKFCQNEKRKLGLLPYKTHFEILKNKIKIKYIFTKKKSEGFGLGLPNLEEVTKEEQDYKMFLSSYLLCCDLVLKSFLRC